jgi:hypothetical protein
MKEIDQNLVFGKLFEIPTVESKTVGDSLKKTLRWTNFKTDETDNDWRQFLGSASNSLSHSKFFAKLAESFCRAEGENFSRKEKILFINGCTVHDLGEGEINGQSVGDISWILKTEENEKEENKIALHIINALNLDEREKKNLEEGYLQTVVGENKKLSRAFRALEKTEYVITALKLFGKERTRNRLGLRPGVKMADDLIAKVIVNNLSEVLTKYAPDYPNSIGELIRSMAPLIDLAFEETLPHLKSIGNHEEKIADFQKNWNEFKRGS